MINQPQYKETTCDECDSSEVMCRLVDGKIWYCTTCYAKNKELIENRPALLSAEEKLARYAENPFGNRPADSAPITTPISVNAILKKVSAQDTTIQVRADMFKAATDSIVDIKKALDADDTVTNKPYALAEILKNRFEHFRNVVFELNEKLVEAGNEQRAIQVYLNQLANQLKVEEREKLKIADINYKPTPPKPVKVKTDKPIKTTGTKKVKFDKVLLKKTAIELGVSEFTLQMLATAKNGIEAAAEYLKALKSGN